MYKLGFIGSGNMGSAILKGLLDENTIKPAECIVSDINEDQLDKLSKACPGIHTEIGNKKTASESEILILAVKPQVYPFVLDEIKDKIKTDTIIVTIAAGFKLEKTASFLPKGTKIIRTMPNTPALIRKGMTAICPNSFVSDEESQHIQALLSRIGETEILPESQFDAFTSLCGSSPAWVYVFIESLADGAVLEGIPRDKAYKMAAQAVLGSAAMIAETGRHPGELKDAVTSPGGTTIEALASLEKNGFRSALIEAVRVCTEKSRQLGK